MKTAEIITIKQIGKYQFDVYYICPYCSSMTVIQRTGIDYFTHPCDHCKETSILNGFAWEKDQDLKSISKNISNSLL